MYYNSDRLGYKYNVGIGKNYTNINALNTATSEKLLNSEGFNLVYKVSGSSSGSGKMDLFTGKYNVEDKPFYNWSGSFYLSFLMRGDETLNGNIYWENNNENHYPKIPFDALYSSSVLQPNVTASKWQRYIYHASQSFWTPHSSNPIVGTSGTISDFGKGSSEVTILSGINVTGSYPIRAGGRYTNLATFVTSSGKPFSGSISPAGELFRIYADTTTTHNAITSSYITDVKITKYNPMDVLPFSEVYNTASAQFTNWYDDQYESASLFDIQNYNSLMKTLPDYFNDDNQIDNTDFRKFVNMMGEHFDIIKNYIDGYGDILKTQYGEVGNIPENLLPVVAQNQNWNFMLPVGKQDNSNLLQFYGSSISNIDTTSNSKNNIWRNIINNLKYIYKTKGTQSSIRALLNSYGFPPDILKIKEHGAGIGTSQDSILNDDITGLDNGIGGESGNVSFTQKEDKIVSYIIDSENRALSGNWRRDSVDGEVVEFVFKPAKGTNTQTLLQSSGSGTGSMWDVILQPSASSDTKARLQFRLNTLETGSGEIGINAISMSTDYFELKNQNFWNVLLQRKSTSTTNTLTSHSYELYVGESIQDKLNVLNAVSMSYGGADYSHSFSNWLGTGSRNIDSGSNLIVGKTMTGSIAEFRVWKQPLSASVFKQHIYDKKSAVGNSLEDSFTNLIYHYRLNENWPSGSTTPVTKDYNPKNVGDYSFTISQSVLGNTPLYDLDVYDRIQFNVGIGGSYEASDNNIIIDNDKRYIGDLNPFQPSVMNVYHPLINKRKASSVLELTRSPQEVINDFILNQLGNFDFNDKFADPQDINEGEYKDLERFAQDFFNHYDISLDVNKFIDAQADLFTKELISSIKRLVPARATFSKLGVELKPTLLERQKISNNKIEKEMLNFIGDIKYADTGNDISDWDTNTFLGKTLHTLYPAGLSKDSHIELASATGSKEHYDFTDQYELIKTKDAHIELASATGSKEYYNFTDDYEYVQYKNIDFDIANNTGSIAWNFDKLQPIYTNNDINFSVASSTGSMAWDFDKLQPIYSNKNLHFGVATSTGSMAWDFDKLQPLYTTKNSEFGVATSTGSFAWDFDKLQPLYTTKNINFSVASSTGSMAWDFDKLQSLYTSKNTHIPIASNTGSIPLLVSEFVQTTSSIMTIATSTGSIAWNFNDYVPLYKTKNYHFNVITPSGSIAYNFNENIPLYSNNNTDLDISVEHDDSSSLKPLSLTTNQYEYNNTSVPIASSTSSTPSFDCDFYTTKDGNLDIIGNESFSDRFDKTYKHFDKDWGRTYDDVWFIHYGLPGSGSTYNTYHYEKRFLYHAWGDVESISGSNPSISSSHETDFTGIVDTGGGFTASKDFVNKTFIETSEFIGKRPLGTTIEFIPTGSISFKGGKFLDETFVYPANHIYNVGHTKDSIERLTYKGTQNTGGDILESEAFTDLEESSFYRILVTGGSTFTVPDE